LTVDENSHDEGGPSERIVIRHKTVSDEREEIAGVLAIISTAAEADVHHDFLQPNGYPILWNESS